MNKRKSLITNKVGKTPNFISLTGKKDPLNIGKGDRRYCVANVITPDSPSTNNNGFGIHAQLNCIAAYKDTEEGEWDNCPCCGFKPKVWVFDNGRTTACGCWNTKYEHFSIHAESIMSVHKRTKGKKMTEYDSDALRKNWNHWCKTGLILFEHASNRSDGRW